MLIDPEAVARFTRACFEGLGRPAPAVMPPAESFGDSPELADELLGLVINGPKRATAGAVADYEAAGDPIPTVGGVWIACDGAGIPRAMLTTTDVRIGPLSSVDAHFAWDEGEGDRSLDFWVEAHRRFFKRRFAELGLPFHADIPVVFERFDVFIPG